MKQQDAGLQHTGLSLRAAILLFGAIAALGSLATQLLVPALPSIAGELGVGIARVRREGAGCAELEGSVMACALVLVRTG